MNVEVNEENILKYSLVQLTGNSKEDLLKAAKEAQENGYTLTCRIPEVEDVLQMNIFEHGDGVEVTDEDLTAFFDQQNPIMRKEEGKQDPPGRQINIIPGEVLESHIEEPE